MVDSGVGVSVEHADSLSGRGSYRGELVGGSEANRVVAALLIRDMVVHRPLALASLDSFESHRLAVHSSQD